MRIGLVPGAFEGSYKERLDSVEESLQNNVSLGFLFFGSPIYKEDEPIFDDSKEIILLKDLAKTYNHAIGIGFVERDRNNEEQLYRSYIFISSDGSIIAKHSMPLDVGSQHSLISFTFKDIRFLVVDEEGILKTEVVDEINRQSPDAVLCLTSIVHNATSWRNQGLGNYADDISTIKPSVMIVNAFNAHEPQQTGGAFLIKQGAVTKELPLGNKGVLIVNENEL